MSDASFCATERGQIKNPTRPQKSDRNRKKYPVKAASDKPDAPLRFFAIREGSQCVVRKMTIYLGKIELHNVAKESKKIKINETWNFTNVRSESEVIESISVRLQHHSIGLIIQNALKRFSSSQAWNSRGI
jgi:hypothetical protein